MKKTLKIYLVSLFFLILCSIIGYFSKYANFKSAQVPLMISSIVFIISLFPCGYGKKSKFLNIILLLMFAIVLGFCIRAWYILRGFDNNFWIMFAVSLFASSFIWLFYLFSFVPGFNSHPKIYTLLFALFFFVIYVGLVFWTETTFLSTLGYYLIIELGFLFASLSSSTNNWELFRKIALSALFVVMIACVIASIATGDFDFDISGIDFSNTPNDKKKDKELKITNEKPIIVDTGLKPFENDTEY